MSGTRIGEFWSYPESRAFAELLIDCEKDRTLRAVLVGMSAGRRTDARRWPYPGFQFDAASLLTDVGEAVDAVGNADASVDGGRADDVL
jgi:hypothetical protein